MDNYLFAKKIRKNNKLLKTFSPLLAQLLYNRGIEKIEEAENFINPKWENNYDPFLMKNIEKALKAFVQSIEKNEKITIYADYDADGIPGSVILSDLLEKISYKNYDIYIPHRHNEGYGIHNDAIEKIINSGTKLIISIDVGITAHESAELCNKNNVKLIITDHHLPLQKNGKDYLPKAFTILNPKQSDDKYPDKMLCGAGVIFKFVQAFVQKYGEKYKIEKGWEKWLLDVLGIATISDMVPLKNENRIFAYYGMKVIQAIAKNGNKHRLGLKNLLWNAGINAEYMTEEDISFGITPRINAASRMSHPDDALNVFISKNQIDAQASVEHLTQLNNERKKLTKKTTDSALALLEEKEIKDVIVVGNKDWKAGILGLVASKLVEKYKVPAFVWSQEGNMIKGSCRSLDELHLVDIMQDAHIDSFINFGGHAEAGGFSCKIDEIDALEKRLQKSVKKYKIKNTKRKKTQKIIDMELSVDAISLHSYQEIRKLAPFGVGNEKPLFLFKDVLIENVRTFGKDKNHLEIFFKNSLGKTIRGIAFFKTPDDFKKLKENKTCDIVAHIEYSVFIGKHELRLQVVDII
jgi:single-stranded-DNA-specific exonuclease